MSPEALCASPLLARGELWSLLSIGLVDPYHRQRLELLKDPELRSRAASAAALLVEEHPAIELGRGELAPAALRPESLFLTWDSKRETIEPTYRRLFGLTAISERCPPCEVEYERNADITFRSQRLADLAGFYRAFGMQVSSRASERLDHVSVEAEFLYLLSAKEAAAFLRQDLEGREVCREARRKFFQEHIGWWLPAFSKILSRLAPVGYYRSLANLAAGLAALERVSLQLPPLHDLVKPVPSDLEARAACFECMGGTES